MADVSASNALALAAEAPTQTPAESTAASSQTAAPAESSDVRMKDAEVPATSPAASITADPPAIAPAETDASIGPDDSDVDSDPEPVVDESQLTPAALRSLQASRRDRIAAKNRAKKAKKKAAVEQAKKRKREEREEKEGAAQKKGKTETTAAPVAAKPAVKPSATAPAQHFGLASILGRKDLRGAEATKPASTTPAAATSTATVPPVAAAAAAAAPAALDAGMSLDDWRKLAADRKELSMAVIGEDVTAQKIAAKHAAAEANRLTGMGGGYKEADGWKCQSYNCNGFINYKNDTVCKRCGAARRY